MGEFLFPPGVPDELQNQIRSMIDRQQMSETSMRQSVSRFFRELSADQLETFAMLMNAAAGNNALALFYEGFARALCAERHGKWPGWDDEPEVDAAVEIDNEGIKIATRETPRIVSLAEHDEYGVAPISGTSAVRCKACGMEYISLEDRKLRPTGPSGCLGCVDKMKWG